MKPIHGISGHRWLSASGDITVGTIAVVTVTGAAMAEVDMAVVVSATK
jgi:hypothetical protein